MLGSIDFLSPLLLAIAVAAVGLLTWVFTTATNAGIGNIVDKSVRPLQEKVTDLESDMGVVNERLAHIDERSVRADREHDKLWDAINDRERRRER